MMLVANTRTLVWEILGKNVVPLLITLVVLPIAWLLMRTYLNSLAAYNPMYNNLLSLSILLMAALNLSFIFAYVDFTPNDLTGGFPNHVLLLPVPTWLLALVPIVTGSFFVISFVLLWLTFISSIEWDWREQLITLAAVTSLGTWIQALSWESSKANVLRIFVLSAVVVVIGFSVESLARAIIQGNTDSGSGSAYGTLGLLATLLSGYGLAYVSVVRTRRGDSILIEALTRPLQRKLEKFFSSSKLPTLVDGIDAQNWFQWKILGWVLPSFTLFFGAMILIGLRDEPSIRVLFISLLMVCMYSTMGSMYSYEGSLASKPREEMSLFAATRPLTDLELALAKLRLTGKSLMLCFAIWLVVIAITLLVSENNTAVIELWSQLVTYQGVLGAYSSIFLAVISAALLSWTGTAYILAATLFTATIDKTKHGWKIAGAILLSIVLVVRLGFYIYANREAFLSAIESTSLIVLLPFAVSSVLLFSLLPRFTQFNQLKSLSTSAYTMLGGIGLCLLLLWQLQLGFGIKWGLSWMLATLALMAFIPFLLLPIIVAWRRHR